MKKLPQKYAGIAFTFYATALMAFIMSAFLAAFIDPKSKNLKYKLQSADNVSCK